ncbi:hypothetical protein SYNTR_0136 [Candidatus Syntrophocurvum alkaliphilum]|uniref:Spore germination protein GerKB n=1 Tax=Candidatus Syntrophocurvum alkaliphilum TaxID=2293317 RepID=A0A6I6DGD2_9FIRM|nr:hypothetical protein SYNTR_0136 [Candidatus Syntrophocurvum alkaliphilum]
MKKSDFVITSKQLIFIIIGCMVTTVNYNLPQVTSTEVGQDAWIPVIIGGLVPLFSIFMIERLHRNFPTQSFVQMTFLIFGKWLGNVIILSFILYIICLQAIVLRICSEITTTFILPQTPIWALSLLFIIVSGYVAIKGAKVVGRMNEFLFYLSLIALIMIILPVFEHSNLTNLLPVAEADISDLVLAARVTLYSYFGVEILFLIYSMVTRKDEVLKAAFTGITITISFYIIVVLACLLVFGAETMQALIWPVMILLKVINIPVFERLELFFLVICMSVGIRAIFNFGFAASFSIADLLNKIKLYPYIIVGYCLFVYIGAQIPENIIEILNWAYYGGYLFLFFGIGYPILYHVVYGIRKEKVMKGVQ